jgi:hypothetical protein
MFVFIIDSTPISQICTFCKGHPHVVGNCPYRSNQVSIFMTKSIFSTTQPMISINSQILVVHVFAVFEDTLSFTIAPNYPITQMLNNQYLTMNPIGNNILLIYLGNYGLSYAWNDNIPNQWTMIPNPY